MLLFYRTVFLYQRSLTFDFKLLGHTIGFRIDGASMPRPLLTNATLELRTDSAEAPPTPGSPRIEADDAGRLRWDSRFRSRSDMPLAVGTTRTNEDQVLMLQYPCLVSVSRSGATLFSQATWSFRSGGSQRMRTIEHFSCSASHQCADVTDSTRWFHENRVPWAECEDANAPSTPRHVSADPKTLRMTSSEEPSSQPLGGLRPARIPSAHVYLPLGA